MYLWVKNVPGNVSGLEITQVTGKMPKPAYGQRRFSDHTLSEPWMAQASGINDVLVPPEKVDISVQRWFEDAMRRVFGKVSW